MSKKIGANVSERKKIASLLEKGYKAEEISEMLYIKVEVIKRFSPDKQSKAKKRATEKNAEAAIEHKEIMDRKK